MVASLLGAMAVDGRLVRLERLDLSWTSITNDSFAAVGRLAGRRLRVMQARGCCLLGRKTITDAGARAAPPCLALPCAGARAAPLASWLVPPLALPCVCLARRGLGNEEACLVRGALDLSWWLAGVCALAAACAELEVLELYDYHGCSDVCAQALASCCPRLRVLKVPCCHAISDQGLVVPGSGWASSLRTLDVSYNGHVDDGCLARALAHLRCLLRLFVSGCKHISDEVSSRNVPCLVLSRQTCARTRSARELKPLPQGELKPLPQGVLVLLGMHHCLVPLAACRMPHTPCGNRRK